MNYYNEHDPFAAQWLRNLIAGGHIAPGIVDTRSIEDVRPEQLAQFTQCHFFAGIGVWSYALRLAGWPDDRPIWTGSCPCQPFSAAGKGAGFADERHLWPAFHWLIDQCRPPVVVGEQVASADGLTWLDLVLPDLEGSTYAVGAADLCAAGVGAPHIRQRLFWVAHANVRKPEQFAGEGTRPDETQRGRACSQPAGCRDPGRMEHAGHDHDADQEPAACAGQPQADRPANFAGGPGIPPCELGDADRLIEGAQRGLHGRSGPSTARVPAEQPAGPTNGLWRSADWLFCRDGKWRPVEPGTSPLATGAPSRVGRLRGYGNALTAQAAEAFIRSVM